MKNIFSIKFDNEVLNALNQMKSERQEKIDELTNEVQTFRNELGMLLAQNDLYNQLKLKQVEGIEAKYRENDELITKKYEEFEVLKSDLKRRIENLNMEVEIIEELLKL